MGKLVFEIKFTFLKGSGSILAMSPVQNKFFWIEKYTAIEFCN